MYLSPPLFSVAEIICRSSVNHEAGGVFGSAGDAPICQTLCFTINPKLILRRTVMKKKLLASILSVMLITVQSQATMKASATRTSADVFTELSGFL
jgi:hypothetical protein